MVFNTALVGSVTVWYNPQPVFVQNINSYLNYSNLLVVVDNSAINNQHLFDEIESIHKVYIWNGENMGIAKALNQGLDILISQGYKFALTFDQDSSFEEKEIEKLLAAAQNLEWERTGLLTPIHVQQKSVPQYNVNEYTQLTAVMTSGNLLNLEVAKSLGFFNEQLFIDHVDNEYCLRLNKAGYKVLVANSFLVHELGKYKDAFILGKRVGGFISHSPDRLYYFVRNVRYILSRYFFVDTRYSFMEVKALLIRFIKLFFEDDTRKRLGLFFKGLSDSKKLK